MLSSPQQYLGMTPDRLTDIEAQIIASYRQFLSVLAHGSAASIVAAEAAFLELTQSVCDMARAPGTVLPLPAVTQESRMEDRVKDETQEERPQDERPEGSSAQGDGDRGADAKPEDDTQATSRDAAAGTTQPGFRTGEGSGE